VLASVSLAEAAGTKILQHSPSGGVPGTIHSMEVVFSNPINAASFDATDVLLLNPAGLPIPVTGISPLGPDRFQIRFPTQTAPGLYTLRVGPDVTDSDGHALDQDGDGIFGEAGEDVFVGQSYVFGSPSPGLAAWWRGEGNVLDSIGAEDGVLRDGATFAPGKLGQAFNLDGTDDFVDIPGSAALFYPGTGSFTMSAWIKTNDAGRTQRIFRRDTGSVQFEMAMGGSGILAGFIRDADAGGTPEDGGRQAIVGTKAFNDGNWHHIVFVRNVTTARLLLYVDCQIEADKPLGPGPVETSSDRKMARLPSVLLGLSVRTLAIF
jgi:hypothetical protein